MAVTLEWLLGRTELALRLVEGSATDTTIGWAHAIELEDPTPWLAGNELVLTTGLNLPRSVSGQRQYVERLASADVAALAFGEGVRFRDIPPAIRRACRSTGLPLVGVPLPVPFIAISQAVAGRLAEQQVQTLQRAVTYQHQITRGALRDGVDGVLQSMTRELGCRALLLDEYANTVWTTGAPGLSQRVRRELDMVSQVTGRSSASVVTSDGGLELQTLQGRSAVRGWLAAEADPALSPPDHLLLNQAASLITLLLDRPRELVESYGSLGSTVLSLLLDSDPARPDAIQHLHQFGFAPGEPVVVALVAGDDDPARLHETVLDQLETGGRPHVIATTHAGLVILLREGDAGDVTDWVARAATRAGRHEVTIGVSGPLAQNRIATGLAPAQRAAASAARRRLRVGWFDTLTLETILADDTVRDHIESLARAPLAPLLDDPSRRAKSLRESLEAFLQHNGSWETASRALGMHRHTLRTHMSQVEQLTGMSLEVAEDRVVLLLALLTHQVQPPGR